MMIKGAILVGSDRARNSFAKHVVEPGEFQIMVGPSPAQLTSVSLNVTQ